MSHLITPLKINNLTLNTRLIMPPMATSKAETDGRASRAILDYYDEKSKGGYISLVIIEHSYISQEGKASNYQLSIAQDSVVTNLMELSKIIHKNGSKTIMQINHAGSAASEEVTGTEALGPSAVANPRKGCVPREMTLDEIKNTVISFKEAARRVKEAGFDGVEIHSAHGYLLNQFLSPLTNIRKDEYGGSIKNRIRIHLEIIREIRKVVGENFPIFIRLGARDFMEGGITIEDSVIAAEAFEKAGADVIDISGGFCGYVVPGLSGQGYFSALSHTIKKAVSIPVILTGGITEANAAEEFIANGKADLVGVGRAILNDSTWAKRAFESLKNC